MKDKIKRIYDYIRHGKGIIPFVLNVVIIVLFVKYIFYPVLCIVMVTEQPIAIVISCSMEHTGNYDEWWELRGDYYEDINTTKEEFKDYSFKNGINTGDMIIIYRTDYNNIKTGDVIVYNSNLPEPIVHRVILIKEGVITTKGDYNVDVFNFEMSITEDKYMGRVVSKVPLIGYIKIFINYII